jgi:Ca-activated chloride channel family protein
MRALLAVLLLTLSPLSRALAASTAWSDLWRTQDQQAQALLEAGQAAQAADRFHDPRRRAYAALEAGRYPDAVKLLTPFTDADSEYNRGNALAKAGQLQQALAAYDAALRQAPADKDSRHNRDLVEHALQQQRQSQPPPKGGQGGSKQGSSGQQQSADNRQNGSGSQQSGANGPHGAHQPGSSGQQQLGQGSDPRGSRTPQAANPNATSEETPGQARRDAEAAAALARQQQRGKGDAAQALSQARNGTPQSAAKGGGKGPETPGRLASGTQTPKQQAESERQLALDQWLRQIPDSPAGLLQRKFLIEHMVRQQGGGEPPPDGP